MFDGVFRQPPQDEGGGLPAAFPAVGPNTVTQTAATLAAHGGPALVAEVFGATGIARYIDAPPQAMVPEGEAARLHRFLFEAVPNGPALLREAGERTADYLLAHRIPGLAQLVLRLLPAPLSAGTLAWAIRRHAWTFAGSGHFATTGRWPLEITLTANALSVPGNPWHCGVFERLFTTLVSRRTAVACLGCCASGDPACRFCIGPA